MYHRISFVHTNCTCEFTYIVEFRGYVKAFAVCRGEMQNMYTLWSSSVNVGALGRLNLCSSCSFCCKVRNSNAHGKPKHILVEHTSC